MNVIKVNDALLLLNLAKNNIPNYIGGNVLLVMGFAIAYGKKLFLNNDIPEMQYKAQIEALLPVMY